LRLTIDTSRNSPYLFDLTPGTSTSSYRINRLPFGRAMVDAQAFPVSCSKVASFTGEPQIAQHDPQRFISGAPAFLTQDEESSGVIDMAGILGPGWYLLDVQAHYATDAETVEGGQLLAVYDPTWLDASSQKVEYAVIGDTPYGSARIADFPNLISAINAAPNISRVVHVGDIKNGSSRTPSRARRAWCFSCRRTCGIPPSSPRTSTTASSTPFAGSRT